MNTEQETMKNDSLEPPPVGGNTGQRKDEAVKPKEKKRKRVGLVSILFPVLDE